MINDLFNVTVDVLRVVRTSDSMGGWTETEPIHINNLHCRINWSKGNEKIQFDKETWFRDAKLYCVVVDIQTKDKIVYNRRIYEVVNVSDVDNAGKFLTVEMKLVE